jgi:hypothetical protein
MPSLKQVNQNRTPKLPKKAKNSHLKRYLKIIAIVIIAFCGYAYFTAAKVVTIPDDIYATRHASFFKSLFDYSSNRVIWFDANNPVSRAKKKVLDELIKENQLNKYYIHRPFLQDSFKVNPTDAMGRFIMDNCATRICLVIPSVRKIVQTSEKHLIRDMRKYKDIQIKSKK